MSTEESAVVLRVNQTDKISSMANVSSMALPASGNEISAAFTPGSKGEAELETSSLPANPRLEALSAKKARLEATLTQLQAERAKLVTQTNTTAGISIPAATSDDETAKIALTNASRIIKHRIDLLQKYNEIKDIAQGLVGMIAEERGVRVGNVMEEFGMSEKD